VCRTGVKAERWPSQSGRGTEHQHQLEYELHDQHERPPEMREEPLTSRFGPNVRCKDAFFVDLFISLLRAPPSGGADESYSGVNREFEHGSAQKEDFGRIA
jgi:hypothetical protein